MVMHQFFVKVHDELPRDCFMWKHLKGKVLLVEGGDPTRTKNVTVHIVKCPHNDEHFTPNHTSYHRGGAGILNQIIDVIDMGASNIVSLSSWRFNRDFR